MSTSLLIVTLTEAFVDANSVLYTKFAAQKAHVERSKAFKNSTFDDVLQFFQDSYQQSAKELFERLAVHADILVSHDNRAYRPDIKLEEELRRLSTLARQQRRRRWYRNGRTIHK